MAVALTNQRRSFRYVGSTSLQRLSVDVQIFAPTQKSLPGSGISDVVNGVLISAVSAKYPSWGYLRWVDAGGRVQGVEQQLDFQHCDLIPTYNGVAGFELYLRPGTAINVSIQNGGGSVNFEDYYTKAEVTALLAALPAPVDAYTKAQTNTLLAGKQAAGSYYTQSQVDTLLAGKVNGFNYVQENFPSSPSDGYTWREVSSTGQWRNDWVYVSALSKWQSINTYQVGCTNQSLAASGVLILTGDPRFQYKATRLTDFLSSCYVTSPNNASNYWTYFLSKFGSATPTGTTFSTASKSAATVFLQQESKSDLVAADVNTSYCINFTKVGAPGAILSTHSLRYKVEY